MRESKNIYEALNNINFNIDDYEKQEISDLEKKKIKRSFMKSRKKQYNFKKIGVIAAALALTIGILSQTDFTQSVYAATQSKISEISYSISQALGIERNIEPYLNVVNQVVEDKGIEVKLTEVIIDEGQLYFATIVDTGKPMDMIDFDYDIFINGKKIVNAGGGAASNSINDSGTIISTHYNRKIKDTKLTGNLDIRIVLKSLNYYENSIPKKMKGKWEFEFTANGAELTATMGVSNSGAQFNMCVLNEEILPGLTDMANSVHDAGGKLFIQLFHAGRNGNTGFLADSKASPVAPSPIPSPIYRETPKELTADEINDIIKDFGKAAEVCKRAGVDAVEISCSAGYLLSEFLSELSNVRQDKYGGTPENRRRFPLEVIKMVRESVGNEYPIGYNQFHWVQQILLQY
jgi:hypothetical protein